jgi:hypothetical protein
VEIREYAGGTLADRRSDAEKLLHFGTLRFQESVALASIRSILNGITLGKES